MLSSIPPDPKRLRAEVKAARRVVVHVLLSVGHFQLQSSSKRTHEHMSAGGTLLCDVGDIQWGRAGKQAGRGNKGL
jgi:hypothetical protein